MTQTPQQPPAGWYPDPAGGSGERFWDGEAWSQATRDAKPTMQRTAPEPSTGMPRHGVGPYAPEQRGGEGLAPAPGYSTYPGSTMRVPAQGGFRLAGFWWRALGYVIDFIIVTVITRLLTSEFMARANNMLEGWLTRLIESSIEPSIPPPPFPTTIVVDLAILTAIAMAIMAAYRSISVGLINATPGQKLLGLKVARLGDESLGPVGWKAAIMRGVAGGVLYQLIGGFAQISVWFTDRKQTIPDLLSKTVVVNTREAV